MNNVPVRVVTDYTPEEVAAFQETFRPLAESYHRGSSMSRFCGAAGLLSWTLGVVLQRPIFFGIVSVCSWLLMVFTAPRMPDCPACHNKLEGLGAFCPECGSRSLQPESRFRAPRCSSCGKSMDEEHKIRACASCGLMLDENGLFGISAGGRGRVICTFFFQQGLLPREVWRADMEFTRRHISSTTVRGYHYWAVPYVKLMRKSALARAVMLPLAKWRAEEVAFQMGILPRPNRKGKVVRLIAEPICWLIGTISPQRDWGVLWEK